VIIDYGNGTETESSAGLSAMNDQVVTGLVNTDAIRLISASRMATSVVSGDGTTIALDNVGDYQVGDTIVINNCDMAQITTITGISGNDLTVSDTLNQSYKGNATVHRLQQATYSVYISPTTGNPTLAFDNGDGTGNQDLIEGVEDMQLLMGNDEDGDRVADFYVDPSTPGLDMNKVVSVKITLSVRTINDNVALQSRIYNGVTDRRISKDYSATIALRNRLN
jgi:type IV pilus assembly protein PilW